MRETDQHAFERPDTFFNKSLDRLAIYEPIQDITYAKVKEWIEIAKKQFEIFFDPDIVEQAVATADWQVIEGKPPQNVWAGEALFNGNPTIRIYTETHLARVPFPALFDALGISLIHHILGHIVPRQAGKKNYGEEAACHYQKVAAEMSEDPILRFIVAPMVPVFSYFHKKIRPLFEQILLFLRFF